MPWTEEQIRGFLVTQRGIERAIVAIFNQQTADEKSTEETRHLNSRGFSGADARLGTYYAKWILSGRHLSGLHLERGRKIAHKYVSQLTKIANKELSVANPLVTSNPFACNPLASNPFDWASFGVGIAASTVGSLVAGKMVGKKYALNPKRALNPGRNPMVATKRTKAEEKRMMDEIIRKAVAATLKPMPQVSEEQVRKWKEEDRQRDLAMGYRPLTDKDRQDYWEKYHEILD